MRTEETTESAAKLPPNSGLCLSIVIPAFNAQATLARTLRSLSCIAIADRPRVQVIVVNDGSTDRTAEIVSDFVKALPEFEWTPLLQANRGVAAARNAGLDAVCGQWILFLDSDDEILTSPLAALEVGEGITCVVFPVQFCRSGKPARSVRPQATPSHKFSDRFTAGNPYPICSLVFRAACLEDRFDPTLRYLEDWKFWWDNPRVFSRMRAGVDAPLAAVHIHGDNRTSHFAQTAEYRGRIARAILDSGPATLTRKQRNNLNLHLAISRVRTGRRHALSGLLAIPCDPVLYAKFLVYLLLIDKIRWIDPYG